MSDTRSKPIDEAIEFLRHNIEFFLAPFESGDDFQQWSKKIGLFPLSEDLNKRLTKNENKILWHLALKELKNGNDEKIQQFLEYQLMEHSFSNQEIIRAAAASDKIVRYSLIDILNQNKDSPTIEQWYQDHNIGRPSKDTSMEVKEIPSPPPTEPSKAAPAPTVTPPASDDPFAGVTLQEFGKVKKPVKREDPFAKVTLVGIQDKLAEKEAADKKREEEAKIESELSKVTDPRERLLYDLQWLCQKLVVEGTKDTQFHVDLANEIPKIRLGILKAIHLHPENLIELHKVVDNLKKRMDAAGMLSLEEFKKQNVPTQKLSKDKQAEQINANLLGVMQKRKLKTASDLIDDQEMLKAIIYDDNPNLWKQLLADPTFNLEATFANNKTILHFLLDDTAKQRPEKILDIIKILLQHPQIGKIINEFDALGHTPMDYALKLPADIKEALTKHGARTAAEVKKIDADFDELLSKAPPTIQPRLKKNDKAIKLEISLKGKAAVEKRIADVASAPSTTKTTSASSTTDPKELIKQLTQIDAALEDAYRIRLDAHIKNVENTQIKDSSGSKSADTILVTYINKLNKAKENLYLDKIIQPLPIKPDLKPLETAITRSELKTGPKEDERLDLKFQYYTERLSKISQMMNYLHIAKQEFPSEMWLALHAYAKDSFDKLKNEVANLLKKEVNALDTIIKPRQKALEEVKSHIESAIKELAEDEKTVAKSIPPTPVTPPPKPTTAAASPNLAASIPKATSIIRSAYFEPFLLDHSKMNYEQQAEAIFKKMLTQQKADEKSGIPPKIGITYSANHEQTVALRQFYLNPTLENWKSVLKEFSGSTHQGAVIKHLFEKFNEQLGIQADLTTFTAAGESLRLLEDKLREMVQHFQILPVSTMSYIPSTRGPEDAWLKEDLEYVRQFAAHGGLVLGWQNQLTTSAGKIVAIGGGVSFEHMSTDQSKYIQDYFRAFAKNGPVPVVPDLPGLAAVPAATPAAAPVVPTSPTATPASPAASPSPAAAPGTGGPGGSPPGGPAAGSPAAKPPAPLPDFTKQQVRDEYRSRIENVKKRFDEYIKLINHYRSVANVAIASMDHPKFIEIQTKCEELEKHLRIYVAYTKYKWDQAKAAEQSPNILDKIRYDDSKVIQKRLKNTYELLVKLNKVSSMKLTSPQEVYAFSQKSKVVDIKDIEAKKDEYLNLAPGATSNPAGVIRNPSQKTTEEFSTKARVNRIEYGQAVIVSVQQTEKGVYQSSLYSNGKLDLSMQGKLLGHRIPNDSLLAIAIKEVQNWRAGNPDSDSTMVLEGAMPKALVEAFILYCEHRGYKYSNDTVHQIKLSSIQKADYRERLKEHPGFFIGDKENRGLLDKGKDVAAAQRNTQLKP